MSRVHKLANRQSRRLRYNQSDRPLVDKEGAKVAGESKSDALAILRTTKTSLPK